MFNKQLMIKNFRSYGLLESIDKFHFLYQLIKNNKDNKKFLKLNPNLALPPIDILHEASGSCNFQSYYNSGLKAAQEIYNIFNQYLKEKDRKIKILEWGCGPGRIVRHLPFIDKGINLLEIYGTDYNPRTVKWLQSNLEGIEFYLNNLEPPLPFQDNELDFIYTISVFTHLSEDLHFQWKKELLRVLRPGGLILMTVHGDNCRKYLLEDELKAYDGGKFILRKNVTEGKRTYLAYQSPEWMKNIFLKDVEIVFHNPNYNSIAQHQDIYVIRKIV